MVGEDHACIYSRLLARQMPRNDGQESCQHRSETNSCGITHQGLGLRLWDTASLPMERTPGFTEVFFAIALLPVQNILHEDFHE